MNIDYDYNEEIKSSILDLYAPQCDFEQVFNTLSFFHKDNDLTDCCLTIRKYDPEEIRENGNTAIEEAAKHPNAKKTKSKKIKTRPVDADKGHAWVASFTWSAASPEDAKQIDYRFYDDGWPGRIVFSKIADTSLSTHIQATLHDSQKDLPEKFKQVLTEMFSS